MRTTDRYLPKPTDTWHWSLSRTEEDINDIVAMANGFYQTEVADIFKTNPAILRRHIDIATTEQKYSLNQQQLIVCRSKNDGKLMGWAWLKRGHYTVYADEEMADAMFLHVDLTLPQKTRITLCAQIIQQWILWCHLNNIPVLISSSIRQEQEAFLKLHERFGFKRNGSVCYYKVENYFKGENDE